MICVVEKRMLRDTFSVDIIISLSTNISDTNHGQIYSLKMYYNLKCTNEDRILDALFR